MDIFTVYIATFFILFLIMPIVYFALQFLLWFILTKCCGVAPQQTANGWHFRRNQPANRRMRPSAHGFVDGHDNVYATSEERPHRYGDIFYIEPNSTEGVRIRDQLEKDDKDLPSYEEVMRMCNLLTPTLTAASAAANDMPLNSIAALPAPPYSETDPNSSAPTASALATTIFIDEPSTSRAAQTNTSTSTVTAQACSTANVEA